MVWFWYSTIFDSLLNGQKDRRHVNIGIACFPMRISVVSPAPVKGEIVN